MYSQFINTPIIVVDVGADGGVHEIEGLASISDVHAFEPRKESYDALVSGDKKLVQHDGKAYSNITYHNDALAGKQGEHKLYITKIPQASSLLEPNMDVVFRVRGSDDETLVVVGHENVNAIRLADFMENASLDWIDYIKIDTQGTELDILIGSKEILPQISVILMEVEFVTLYKNQPLFEDCVSQLWEHGFRFLDLPLIATTTNDLKGKKVWGEAIFVNTRICPNKETAIKKAMVLLELGYSHDASWLMADNGISQEEIKNISDAFFTANESGYAKLALRAIRYVQHINAKRRSEGKLGLNFQWIKKLLLKSSLGKKLMNAINLNISDKK